MSCSYYTFRQNDYYCTKKGDYVNSDVYYRYCRNYSYDECPIYKQQDSSGCYLTTIVCKVLGKKDNDLVLNVMRNFRDNVLQTNPDYYDILRDYDMIGPSIAKAIELDENNKQLSSGLYNNNLSEICKAIMCGEENMAVDSYLSMTSGLIDYYGLREEYDNLDRSSYNVSSDLRGHARVLSI